MIGTNIRCNKMIDIPICSACENMYRCNRYITFYRKNYARVVKEINDYIKKHPKYKKGVIMATEKKGKEFGVLINGGKVVKAGNIEKLKEEILKNLEKYGDAIIIPTKTYYIPIVKLEKKNVRDDNDIMIINKTKKR